jgi:hypothetical protein
MKSLGKILFLLFFTINLIASEVSISVSAPAIYKGENVSFTLTASSSDVEFPNITQIDNFPILGVSSSSSTSIINGSYSKKISKTYTFKPTKNVTIPSFKIKVDGKTYTTKQKNISVLQPSKSKNGDAFMVELKLDKNSLRVGESTKLRVFFKQRLNARADKLNINEPKIENFWVKKIDNNQQYSQGEYIVQEFNYMIFAQKAGTFHIDSIEADIGHIVRNYNGGGFFNDPFFNSMTNQLSWKKIYSNDLDIKVEALPNNLELYGDFHIKASTDKTTVYANKPVNLTVKIDGIGNIDDIEKFDINIPNAIVYADKPNIKSQLINGEYSGAFTQKIAIISDSDFTIPSLELKYFDKLTNKIKNIQTKPLDIKVHGGNLAKMQEPMVQKAKTIQTNQAVQKQVIVNTSDNLEYLYFLIGILIGSVGTYLVMKQTNKKEIKKENDIIKVIKGAKSDKVLFDILLPYSKENSTISDILKLLEENIYKKTNHKINKQKLYDIFL